MYMLHIYTHIHVRVHIHIYIHIYIYIYIYIFIYTYTYVYLKSKLGTRDPRHRLGLALQCIWHPKSAREPNSKGMSLPMLLLLLKCQFLCARRASGFASGAMPPRMENENTYPFRSPPRRWRRIGKLANRICQPDEFGFVSLMNSDLAARPLPSKIAPHRLHDEDQLGFAHVMLIHLNSSNWRARIHHLVAVCLSGN